MPISSTKSPSPLLRMPNLMVPLRRRLHSFVPNAMHARPILARATEKMLRILDGARIERVSANSYFTGGVETEEQLEQALTGLREQCMELIAAGKKVLVQ